MKKLIVFGLFALFSFTAFSCTSDETETNGLKTETKKERVLSEGQASEPDGPGDDPINLPPPKK
ncbi:hypothetical protein NU08_0240 [Flavobacterium anhuiense]|uniref:Lipoprotein n=1 Tax=Flavobacterium anhuiense TaxID=459526 RepID=A0A444W4T7_9FLAO|nr:hypothetical protein [Flavobacterium anhuiense]RYJ40803.1 hypothetical protein NU08_0240 [Flavobacterium anhuiense]